MIKRQLQGETDHESRALSPTTEGAHQKAFLNIKMAKPHLHSLKGPSVEVKAGGFRFQGLSFLLPTMLVDVGENPHGFHVKKVLILRLKLGNKVYIQVFQIKVECMHVTTV